ncbi:hypothetical protein BJY04DRAFT_213225 [Aspergillus karnatakaensis]|uniref:uncharacterized protein n=1 Tax=Aspergillus karnatakaensis TaxID=1810916 RepID=UPI003CCD9F51
MKFTALIALALAAVAIAAPAAEPELVKRDCASDCRSIATRSCNASCGSNGTCRIECTRIKTASCIRDYC